MHLPRRPFCRLRSGKSYSCCQYPFALTAMREAGRYGQQIYTSVSICRRTDQTACRPCTGARISRLCRHLRTRLRYCPRFLYPDRRKSCRRARSYQSYGCRWAGSAPASRFRPPAAHSSCPIPSRKWHRCRQHTGCRLSPQSREWLRRRQSQ